MKNRNGASIMRKISILVLVMVVSSTSFVGIFSFSLYRRDSISVSAERAQAIALSVAAAVDPVQYKEIVATQEKNQHWFDLKAMADKTKNNTGVKYLYLLEKQAGSDVIYFIEANAVGEEPDLDLGDPESAEYYADEMFEIFDTGKPTATGLFDSGDYGMMVSGFAPILDSDGTVLGVVGADIIMEDVMRATNIFGLVIILCVIVFSAGFWLISRRIIRRSVGVPISALSSAAGKIAVGDMDVELTCVSNDEVGRLTAAFRDMVDSTKKQIAALERLAAGDLTAEVTPRSDHDSMSFAMIKTIDNLNAMFGEINISTTHVSRGADQIATASQLLAQGATEQASTVDHLETAIAQVSAKTGENAAKAVKAASLASAIRDSAEKSSGQMDRMMLAVKEINEASQSIGRVIKVIDDIAFQTNILALNAAVEAARAGQHGKGFAVVADEVRNLAVKSAEAAKDTGSLIQNSINKAELGARIADETAASLTEIVAGINESSQIVGEIAKSSGEQNEEIGKINSDIDQVAQIIQQNSATAEQSAASSDELNAQSGILHELVERFKLK